MAESSLSLNLNVGSRPRVIYFSRAFGEEISVLCCLQTGTIDFVYDCHLMVLYLSLRLLGVIEFVNRIYCRFA